MRDGLLSPAEARLWNAWKTAGESVMARIGRDIADATGLSGADFGVLSRLVDDGGGELRQQALATSMGWDKSRLSHQLTRMENRGLIRRRPADGKGVVVVIAAAGKKALADARPVHARSIRRHLIAPLGSTRAAALGAACKRLQDDDPDA